MLTSPALIKEIAIANVEWDSADILGRCAVR